MTLVPQTRHAVANPLAFQAFGSRIHKSALWNYLLFLLETPFRPLKDDVLLPIISKHVS